MGLKPGNISTCHVEIDDTRAEKSALVYRVTISYKDFYFTDKAEALAFAENAKLHSKKALDVEIKIMLEPEVEEELKEE